MKPLTNNVADMFAGKKLPQEALNANEFKNKNFQSMIIKPPKPIQREVKTASNFRPNE
jgi:hypothetical protein